MVLLSIPTNHLPYFQNAQFIIISLRSNMFELADRLVGIYKTYNCTKTVTINPGKIASAASATASDNLHAAHAAAAGGGGTGNTQAAAGTQEPTQKKRHLVTSASASGAALQDQAAAKNAKVAATAAEWFNIANDTFMENNKYI